MDINEDIKSVKIEDLVEAAVKAKYAIDELEANLQVLRDELGDRLRAVKLQGIEVGNYYISRMKRVSFPDVTMQEAEEWGAIKKSIDTEKLKALHGKGVAIKAKVTEYVNIRQKKDSGE